MEGGYHSNHYSPADPRAVVTTFLTDYEAKHGKAPDALAVLAYDAANVLLEAIKQADTTDTEKVRDALAAIEMNIRYAGYVAKERARAERLHRQGEFKLPPDLPYLDLQSLCLEARQKLDRIRPRTLAQAARIPGVAPSDLQNLMMEVRKAQRTDQPTP